jgi:hypothetical protein
MNVLCLDPVAANSLRHLEVVSSYACSHSHTMMPFFGCVSVHVDRDAGTVSRTGAASWTNSMECDRNLKYGAVGDKCHRVREENTVRLLTTVEAIGLHDKDVRLGKAELEELAASMGRKRRKSSGVILPKINGFGRALKREASMVSHAVERYRDTATFLG